MTLEAPEHEDAQSWHAKDRYGDQCQHQHQKGEAGQFLRDVSREDGESANGAHAGDIFRTTLPVKAKSAGDMRITSNPLYIFDRRQSGDYGSDGDMDCFGHSGLSERRLCQEGFRRFSDGTPHPYGTSYVSAQMGGSHHFNV